MTRIAFLGLGHMGLPMAKNLVAAGHEVHGFDLVPAAVEAAQAAGIPVAASGADAVRDAEVVITMFPAGRHVIDAYRTELLAAARPNTLFIESSTIAVDEARAAHALARSPRGIAMSTPPCRAVSWVRRTAHSPSWSAVPTTTSRPRCRCSRPWESASCTAVAPDSGRRRRSATT
ncbi:hypothetical protein QE375_002516 [Microbacterium foliorum]|uniref:6-phosphogluconate dehydrogenase NADP-binding domain-containing protein n=1 Tax=Microbacterium foliorum TaxID=104336 RepID=A0ABU1HT07_9MICO|nr:hypothetical protein [Microbacterium foliorum]